GGLLVLAGDFNTTPERSPTLRAAGLAGAIPESIDQALVRGAPATARAWSAEERAYGGRLLSDHAPLATTIHPRAPPPPYARLPLRRRSSQNAEKARDRFPRLPRCRDRGRRRARRPRVVGDALGRGRAPGRLEAQGREGGRAGAAQDAEARARPAAAGGRRAD